MKDPKRIPRILEQLRALWLTYPDQRLSQLISNLGTVHHDWPDIFNLEDDKLEEELRRVLKTGWE